MKNSGMIREADSGKVAAIAALYVMSALIILSGLGFTVYSLVNDVRFSVLGTQVPGALFSVVVLFLGVRYFLSVDKLKAKVYMKSSKFSWRNFKKDGAGKKAR